MSKIEVEIGEEFQADLESYIDYVNDSYEDPDEVVLGVSTVDGVTVLPYQPLDIDHGHFTFNEYQKLTLASAVYPEAGDATVAALSYCGLGLGGETGEVLEHLKKVQRDHAGVVSPERREALSKELGDVLWYLGRLASELGLELDTVARKNIEKLQDRKNRGVIQGSGDNR
jgi:NTP pyrophosphatase (non-canonical NTP hydrolase)